MPIKPSYLLLTGAGAVVVYAGFKGKGVSSALRTVIQGKPPSAAATDTANQITSAQAAYGYMAAQQAAQQAAAAGLPQSNTSPPNVKGAPLPIGPVTKGPAPSGLTLSPGAAKALGLVMVTAAGWGAQFSSFNSIVEAESGWQTTIHNGGGFGYVPGLAYGIPQALPGDKMASAGANWQTSSYTQIKWMIGYIRSSYGDPDNAWAFHRAHGWY